MAAKEITKEDCRQLYNLHAQVETIESIIKDLEEFVKSQGEIPTEEMRDEFHKNFKELIESCKELL